jgi:hypothetical protein
VVTQFAGLPNHGVDQLFAFGVESSLHQGRRGEFHADGHRRVPVIVESRQFVGQQPSRLRVMPEQAVYRGAQHHRMDSRGDWLVVQRSHDSRQHGLAFSQLTGVGERLHKLDREPSPATVGTFGQDTQRGPQPMGRGGRRAEQ